MSKTYEQKMGQKFHSERALRLDTERQERQARKSEKELEEVRAEQKSSTKKKQLVRFGRGLFEKSRQGLGMAATALQPRLQNAATATQQKVNQGKELGQKTFATVKPRLQNAAKALAVKGKALAKDGACEAAQLLATQACAPKEPAADAVEEKQPGTGNGGGKRRRTSRRKRRKSKKRRKRRKSRKPRKSKKRRKSRRKKSRRRR